MKDSKEFSLSNTSLGAAGRIARPSS